MADQQEFNPEGPKTTQTYYIGKAPHTALSDQLVPGLVSSIPGIVAALVATYLAGRGARRLAADRAVVERNEAIRKESNNRRIDAMAGLVGHLIAMMESVDRVARTSRETGKWYSAHHEPAAMGARQLVELYFYNTMHIEFEAFSAAYDLAYRNAAAFGFALYDDSQQFKQTGIRANLPESARLNEVEFYKMRDVANDRLTTLLGICGKMMRGQLVPMPPDQKKKAGAQPTDENGDACQATE